MSRISFNNNLILTPYNKTRELKSTQVATGFAMTSQKVTLACLELLVDTSIVIGNNEKVLLAGTKVYFKEATLFVQQWARDVYESEDFEGGFVIGNTTDILYVE